MAVDEQRKEIELLPARGGRVPLFGSSGALVHDRIRAEMRNVYRDSSDPVFVDSIGRELLFEGRTKFRQYDLGSNRILRTGKDVLVFPWKGDRAMNTLVLQLKVQRIEAQTEGLVLMVRNCDPVALRDRFSAMASAGPVDPIVLASSVQNLQSQKHHVFLSREQLVADFALSELDSNGAWQISRDMATGSISP